MKDCDDYCETLRRYLDGELRGQELLQFRDHLEQCAGCRQELAAEEELSRLLHRTRPLYTAPDALRERVLRAMEEPAMEEPATESMPGKLPKQRKS
jgi:mycothiol system anti-sigma-R factor